MTRSDARIRAPSVNVALVLAELQDAATCARPSSGSSRLITGSSIVSIIPASGTWPVCDRARRVGGGPPVQDAWRRRHQILSISRSSRSWTISCQHPRKPQRTPKPSGDRVSGLVENDVFHPRFSARPQSGYSCPSTDKNPAKTICLSGLKPWNAPVGSAGFGAVSPIFASLIF